MTPILIRGSGIMSCGPSLKPKANRLSFDYGFNVMPYEPSLTHMMLYDIVGIPFQINTTPLIIPKKNSS